MTVARGHLSQQDGQVQWQPVSPYGQWGTHSGGCIAWWMTHVWLMQCIRLVR